MSLLWSVSHSLRNLVTRGKGEGRRVWWLPQESRVFPSFLEHAGSLQRRGTLLLRNEPETVALWIVPSSCLVVFLHDETGEWHGCQKTLIPLSWWTSPSGALCQEVHTEDKSDAVCGMWPIYRAGQSATEGGPVCPPGCPFHNPLVTATSKSCLPWQRGRDGQPVK